MEHLLLGTSKATLDTHLRYRNSKVVQNVLVLLNDSERLFKSLDDFLKLHLTCSKSRDLMFQTIPLDVEFVRGKFSHGVRALVVNLVQNAPQLIADGGQTHQGRIEVVAGYPKTARRKRALAHLSHALTQLGIVFWR